MNELIVINKNSSIGGCPAQTVKASDLHAFLESKADFSSWVKTQIDRARLLENRDFVCSLKKGSNGRGGHNAIEYHLSVESAKHVAMMSGTPKGCDVRDYFIECERRAKTGIPVIPQTFADALRLAADQAEQIALMAPKAAFFDAVTDSATAVDMAIVAKTLNMGIGRNQLFEFLRDKGILDRRNIPYQTHCDRGYFRVVESQYNKPDGTACVSFKTVVFQKGMDFIRKTYSQRSEG